MVGTIWVDMGAIGWRLLVIWVATGILSARQASAARNGRVSREFLFALLISVPLLLGLMLLRGVRGEPLWGAVLGVFWCGILALWLAGIILFARKTTGARNAQVAREALLVWLIFLALSIVVILPGGMEAWLTTAARFFVSDATARRVGQAGWSTVLYGALGVHWFFVIRRGHVMRQVFNRPLETDAQQIQQRVDELWDEPPRGKLRLLLATVVALCIAGFGLYASWNRARYIAHREQQRRTGDETWFRRSVRQGIPEVLSMYLERGVDINAAGDNGYTALHVAAVEGHANVAEFLLANGADANAANINDHTPLHFAVLEGHQDVVEVLLANGAHVNPRDWEGKTPLRLALDKGHEEIARLLREHGGTE